MGQNVPLSSIGKIVEQSILQMLDHYENVVVDKYCVIPDHIHLILRIESHIAGQMVSAPTIPLICFFGVPVLGDHPLRRNNGPMARYDPNTPLWL